MKKISVLALVSVMMLESFVVEAAPHGCSARRAAARKVTQKTSTTNNNTTTETTTSAAVEDTTTNTENDTADMVASRLLVKEIVRLEENNDKLVFGNEISGRLQEKIEITQQACSGIKHSLDTIFGLSVATTVSSGLGTVAAGAALATGIAKSKTDKEIDAIEEKLKLLNSRTDNLSDDPEELKKQITEILPELQGDLEKVQSYLDEKNKKSKTLGNVRTGLMAGATVTSAVSMGTSIGATLSASKLADKMAACNKAIQELKLAKTTAEAEADGSGAVIDGGTITKANAIIEACTGYDESNINALRKLSKANAIISGIGTATAAAGTATSVVANRDKIRDDNSEAGKKKEKGLNLASNILAGVTAGTSGTSTALSAIQINKAKKDSEMAKKCESALLIRIIR